MEKYIKSFKNQDLNDFLLETLTRINYHRRYNLFLTTK